MLKFIFLALKTVLRSRRQLALENIALRHQLEVLQRNTKRPRLRPSDQVLWSLLSRFLPDWRRIIHFNVTPNSSADWTSLQLIQAFPFDTAPPYLIRDRDGVYGQKVMDALDFLDIEQIVTAPRSPWQNGYCERVIGTIRRECLDHLTVLGEKHLQQVLKEYLAYYHRSRTHRGLVDRYMSDSHLRQEIDNVEGRFPERTDVLPLKYLRSESVATTTQACVNSGWIKWEGQRYREFTYSSFLSSIFVFPWQYAGPLSVVPSCLCLYFPCHPYLFLLA